MKRACGYFCGRAESELQESLSDESGTIEMEAIEISCIEVRRELSNYVEEDVSAEFRARIDEHLRRCPGCRAVFDGVRNILTIVGTGELYRVPPAFGTRLYLRLLGEFPRPHDVC